MPIRTGSHEKSGPLCKQAGRLSNTHFLSTCKYLPEQDRKFMLKAREIVSVLDGDPDDDALVCHEFPDEPPPHEFPEPTQPHTASLCSSPSISIHRHFLQTPPCTHHP